MKLYAGIDGGQSATQALIGGQDGSAIASGEGPPADLVGLARDAQRQADAIETALCNALERARLPAGTPFESIVVGLSGFEASSPLPQLPLGRCRHLTVVHDAEIAHAGALGGELGVLVLAGTGSAAFGVDRNGRRVLAGGWGYLFGDEGSAFRIARDAIAFAMHAADAGRESSLAPRTREFFGVNDLRDVQLGFAHGEISRARVAAFAREIVALAQRDSGEAGAQARVHLDAAVLALVTLCTTIAARLGDFGLRFSYAGGLFESEFVRARFTAALSAAIRGARIETPQHDAAAGALRLATKSA